MRASTAVSVAIIVVVGALPAEGSVEKCRRTIAKEHGKYVSAVAKALDDCKRDVVRKANPDSLADCAPAALPNVAQAAARLRGRIAAACGGRDRQCGTADDDPLAASWSGPQCMGFEGQCAGITLGHCGGITDCLACVGELAAEQAVDGLLYDRFNPSVFHPNDDGAAERAANRCEVAIAASAVKFVKAKTKALGKCWDRKIGGKSGFADAEQCPDTDPRGTAAEQIARAEAKKVAAIAAACTDGVSPLPLDAFAQTPFVCPDVRVPSSSVMPGGRDCGTISVTDLQSYVDCIDCVLEFKADCMAAAGVGDGQPSLGIEYPTECNAPDDGCPTRWSFTANGPDGDIDFGASGIVHDQSYSTSSQLTLALAGCAGDAPACGQCVVGGAVPDGSGAAFNRRCRGDTDGQNGSWIPCTTSAECPGLGNACVLFFGAPQSVSHFGLAACITTELASNVTGTVNVDSGAAAFSTQWTWHLAIKSFNTMEPFGCPTCDSGVCIDGERDGMPCTPHGNGPFGAVLSLDCPPPHTQHFADRTYSAVLTTGAGTATLGASSPACSALGWAGKKCPCDTCDDAAATPCASDADCGAGHVCGGLRCLEGTPAAGTPCSAEGVNTDPACGSGGACGRTGEPTRPNACSNGVCSANPADTDSIDEGRCSVSPNDNHCVIESFRGCVTNAHCPAPGDSCTIERRQCFTMNGNIGDDVTAAGTASATNPTLAGVFCIGATSSSATNSLYGLPGLGRVTIPGVVTLD